MTLYTIFWPTLCRGQTNQLADDVERKAERRAQHRKREDGEFESRVDRHPARWRVERGHRYSHPDEPQGLCAPVQGGLGAVCRRRSQLDLVPEREAQAALTRITARHSPLTDV